MRLRKRVRQLGKKGVKSSFEFRVVSLCETFFSHSLERKEIVSLFVCCVHPGSPWKNNRHSKRKLHSMKSRRVSGQVGVLQLQKHLIGRSRFVIHEEQFLMLLVEHVSRAKLFLC